MGMSNMTKAERIIAKFVLSKIYRCIDKYGVLNVDAIDMPQFTEDEKSILHDLVYRKRKSKGAKNGTSTTGK